MAALIEGQQYGLSAQDKINSNKSIVFVKLTDSALRSIEEYVKYKGGAGGNKPTIQFQNSNGILSFPQKGTTQKYGFSLSNVEADGPQGSFECLRQTGHRSLESLGCMHIKMHIHANEDSYENTRVKMSAIEKEKINSCTKVIKPAGAHLGRKIKVKRPGLIVNPVKPHNSPPSASMLNKIPVKTNTVASNPVKTNTVASTGSSNNMNTNYNNNIPSKKLPEHNKFQKNLAPKPKYTSSLENVVRQPMRDRIIHLLAIRAFKRPELINRLIKERVLEKDRKGIGAILSQVGVLKGNVYNLVNGCWNEVQDNWKFCSADELEIIRRRKQQYLNSSVANESPPPPPPSSSPAQKRLSNETFSVGQEPRAKKQRISHYSRTDTYNPTFRSEVADSTERLHLTTTSMSRKSPYSPSTNGADQDDSFSPKSPSNSCDGFSKKAKVFPYSRTDPYNQSVKKDSLDSSNKLPFTPATVNRIGSSHVSSVVNEPGGISPKSPENSCDGYSSVSLTNSVNNHQDEQSSCSLNLRNASREDEEKSIRKHTTGLIQQSNKITEKSYYKGLNPTKRYETDESNIKSSSLHSKTTVNSDIGLSSQTLSHARLSEPVVQHEAQVSPDSNTPYKEKETKKDYCSKNVNGYVNGSIKSNGYTSNQTSYNSRSIVTSTTNGSCSTSPHSPESCSDSNESAGENSPDFAHLNLPPTSEIDFDSEIPDYEIKYTKIVSHEQRTRYKDEFAAQYQEYLTLHERIDKIKAKFRILNDHLAKYEKGSKEFLKISSKVIEQYRAYTQETNYAEAEERLTYLHNKLSHIKKLVMEYDLNYYKS